ncbi:winged helix-turn-helix transcriptional regulator [Campylobacter coli]|uniref:Winged helix-turn-helix transcriptional regulator n=1 Tax=Campylobacter coli TaxID=195 RepID=A0A691X201_CAMCO|nr:replication/maintenance protein RepL [Campylobacter coli]EAI4209499.1 winged helix-turn-helix transcriptional regulator [Campylobacter coli]EAI5942618.1 winged helix-turn-helix transcriptional regulator [Campylobacter coli]EAJ2539833.1 winged helix-turn-helix transcriptional regulator [Campylobacter coli]EAJ3598670.1 winged helix-turn-helix transcriptional regulator [Campylobacter coli]EAJ4278336.1 winged helix-turn-helix transcriptional regulator [Campylobacter coli]
MVTKKSLNKTFKISKVAGYHRYFREEIDKETGEVNLIEVDKSFYQDLYNKDFNFMKMFTNNMLNVIKDFFGGAKADIFNILIKNADKENCIFATQSEIAEACNTSREEVNKNLKSLEKCGFIKKIKNGVYQINVDYLFKGSHTQRMNAKEKFTKPLKK